MSTKHTEQFRAKNEARKLARRIAGPVEAKKGRLARKSWAFLGSFGNLNPYLYNLCVVGTAGFPRDTKSGRDDYDEGSDYDG